MKKFRVYVLGGEIFIRIDAKPWMLGGDDVWRMLIGLAFMFCATLIPLDVGNYCIFHSITCLRVTVVSLIR